ncbi:(2Fe-2S)-binding protein [Salipaludibacillus keqinensis]|uniref:(2Fe-2S)-binding protein n=1 Tax=Salipaludibacillus keqinensis TaxID=2045207 RepID=A0A323TJQ7_9BACI|nr:2Fe-2S iron-sulfur cluster-binding protein [Salipaludibacillus keqinensis]PYZ95221.1 (2Fe-2S)-binding protein [Salipaludibacillus keqinensis]
MPKIIVEGYEPFETESGTKLVLALEDHGIDILHRCGGKAKCTTCRVDVTSGEFGPLTEVEQKAFQAKGLDESSRLSCQVRVTNDVVVKPKMTVSSTGLDPGPRPDK